MSRQPTPPSPPSAPEPATRELGHARTVRINWEGIARMLGWTGTIDELKKVRLADLERRAARAR
jgi:hypothetical protein